MGASGTVTGSSYIVTSESGQSIMIDMGMFQGTPEIEQLNYVPYEYDCNNLVGAVLTHAHLDHCGRLPLLLSKGFTGNIWMTLATRDLAELALLDSAKIAERDKKRFLYDTKQVETTISSFKSINYDNPFQLGNFTITLRDAGHILGSASVEITDNTRDSNLKKIVFSGDLGNIPDDLLQTTEYIDSADVVIMESTYGDRLHPRAEPKDTFITEIQTIEKTGGTLLIPAFSLDRTQEILHLLKHLKEDHKIREQTPIFLDSPMGIKATEIYLKYPQLFNSHIQSDFQIGNPFDFPGLEVISTHDESEAIHKRVGPKVIIAGSGMMNGGRIVRHAAYYLPILTTRLLIVGYQAEDTLGRELKMGAQKVTIEQFPVQVKATIQSIETMSSHADQRMLITWVNQIKGVKRVYITHGEDASRTALSQKIKEELHISDIVMPGINQEFDL